MDAMSGSKKSVIGGEIGVYAFAPAQSSLFHEGVRDQGPRQRRGARLIVINGAAVCSFMRQRCNCPQFHHTGFLRNASNLGRTSCIGQSVMAVNLGRTSMPRAQSTPRSSETKCRHAQALAKPGFEIVGRLLRVSIASFFSRTQI